MLLFLMDRIRVRPSRISDSNPATPNSTTTMPILSPLQSYKWVIRVGAVVLLIISLILLLGISSNSLPTFPHVSMKTQLPELYSVEVVHEFPHDPTAFTQGLLYWGNDTLYESTGLYGESTVRRVSLQTGKVEAQHELDKSIFGEGLTLLGERLYQVTWLQKTGFIYDRNNLSKVTTFTHHMNDGWGLASDGKSLYGSDGSSTLYEMDPQTMKVIQKHTVRYQGLEVPNLNELEYINGEVWANVFQTDCIARLAPDGSVVGWILLKRLREKLVLAGEKNFDVLNGIAWDSNKRRIFVTGKLWAKLFEIQLRPIKKHTHVDIQKQCIREPFQFHKT